MWKPGRCCVIALISKETLLYLCSSLCCTEQYLAK